MVPGPVPKHETAVAIGTLHEGLVTHLEIDPRMTERAPNAFAGHAGVIDRNDFRDFDGHGEAHGISGGS
jgi:hypothetical protein